MTSQCNCNTCPVHNFYELTLKRHRDQGDEIMVRKRHRCGCSVIHARNMNIYDGSDIFEHKCPQCKEYPTLLKKEKARIRREMSAEYKERLTELTKQQKKAEPEQYVTLGAEISRLKGERDARIQLAYRDINITKPDREVVITFY